MLFRSLRPPTASVAPLNRSIYSSGEFTLLAVTGDVAHTASADFRVFRHLADIGGVMPAARAFLTFSFTQCDFQPFEQFALLRISGRARIVCDVRPGGQQDKSQFIAQRIELSRQIGISIQRDCRFQRAADFLIRTRLLDHLVDFATHLQQLVPEIIVHRFVVGQAEQTFIPLAGEDIFLTLAR